MKNSRLLWPILLCLVSPVRAAGPALRATRTTAPEEWLRQALPLPKQISVPRQVTLPAVDVGLRLAPSAGIVEQTAADELRALFRDQAKTDLTGAKFEILLGVCAPDGRLGTVLLPDAIRLKNLPNSDQAYIIRPVRANRIVLAAVNPKGVYYAAQALRQLLANRFRDGNVTLPLASVTDWPDLAERGEWGGSADRDIVWMAHRKLNLIETHVRLRIDDDGHGRAHADEARIELGRRHAVKVVPIVMHLDQLMRSGIYERFPELKGKGDHTSNSRHTVLAPCCSQPRFTDILTDWMRDLAAQKGVSDVCVWLSEDPVYCDCEKCRATGLAQHALEARCVVRAWRRVRNQFPKLGLRILLTQGSYKHNDQVLAQVPDGVGVTYYDGGRTYNSSRDSMIYPLLAQYAARGRWLGCYPQIMPSWRIASPWSAPQFIKFRMTEFVDKKLSCLCAYAIPANAFCDFNVNAAAEWSWNAYGRDERAFCRAYFTRQHSIDSDAAADWALLLGPVGWDVYGSRVPYTAFFGEAAAMIARHNHPSLGKGMYRYFPTVEHIRDDLGVCRKAMTIARRLDAKPLILETQVVQGFVEMLDAIRLLGNQLADTKGKAPDAAARRALQQQFNRLSVAGLHTTQGLDAWELLCGNGRKIGGGRLRDTVNVTEKTVLNIGRTLTALGVMDPLAPYRNRKIGGWETHDFDKTATVRKVWDVTDVVTVPGTWRAAFRYTSGWWALNISRVALTRAPKGHPENKTEVSVDKHPGNTGAVSKDNVYALALKTVQPNSRYCIVADVRGVTSVGKPENRRGCNGSVFLQADLPAAWESMAMNAVPTEHAGGQAKKP